jgi:hypothetical protein
LIVQLEKYLHNQVPRLLQKELGGMMKVLDIKRPEDLRKYSVTIETKKKTAKLATIGDLQTEYLSSSTRLVALELRLGRPEILHLRLVFPAHGRPRLELVTVSQAVKKYFPKIIDGLLGSLGIAANRNWVWHRRVMQVLILVAVPAAMIEYGQLAGVDPFFLYASSGWLVLLGGILGLTLPRLFPQVSFRTRWRFSLRRALMLLLLALNLAAIGGYAWLLAFRLDLLTL